MTSVQQQYIELLDLTKRYLTQEHAPAERIFADPDCYYYFREYAMRKTQPAQAAAGKQSPKTTPPQTISAANTAPVSSKPAALPSRPTQIADTPPDALTITPATPPLPLTTPLPQAPPLPLVKGPQASPTPPSSKSPGQLAPASTKEETPSQPPPTFVLEIPAPAPPNDLKDVWELVKERLPGVDLLAMPPNDTMAKEAARLWERKPAILEVAILSFEVEPRNKAFLDNLSKALKAYGISAVVVNAARAEQEKAWPRLLEAPHVRLIIAGGYGLYTLTTLMQYYVEGERPAGPKLGKIPLLMLSDAALYLKEPSLKPSLWKSLKEMLAIPPQDPK